ncbi:hypothetical protein HDE68_004424 [Pedobacter cryoconitis]|uniref:Uncharacterized protein n=1 Tax=Pedobacter cryoconitis TaxID=188932 RepID=A0A7W8ZR96_9SPHI|nr:hypothetical protein [Pedobacter cryoconitis]MBB5638495.1 hypothetical protein [Pedobacter cryoconitis]
MKNFKMSMLTVLLVSLLTTFGAFAQTAQDYQIILYDHYQPIASFSTMPGLNPGNINHTANYNQIINLRDYNINDRADNALISAYTGSTITFYKNADADGSRGICVVHVKQNFSGYKLTSLEHTYEDAYIKVDFYSAGRNSLNGELSCIVVTPPNRVWN